MHQYENLKFRHEAFLQEAERYRMISQFSRGSSRRRISLYPTLAWWGSKLSRWGHVLEERFSDQGMVEDSRVTN
jgi:hypothetical protein